MSNIYHLHQLENTEKNSQYIFQSYDEIAKMNHPIREEDYQKVFSGIPQDGETPEVIMGKLAETNLYTGKARAVSRSDVLFIIQGNRKNCYYYDPPDCILIEGFLCKSTTSNGGITNGTRDYLFEGKDGFWRVVDTVKVEGTMFFLMGKQDTSERGNGIVVNKDAKIVCENCQSGFNESVIAVIKRFIHPEQLTVAVEHPRPASNPKLETYQKYFENGEALRSGSSEVGEEQNYNMIDGVGNNKKSRKRVSVRKRLREKQQLLHGGVEKQRLLEKA